MGPNVASENMGDVSLAKIVQLFLADFEDSSERPEPQVIFSGVVDDSGNIIRWQAVFLQVSEKAVSGEPRKTTIPHSRPNHPISIDYQRDAVQRAQSIFLTETGYLTPAVPD